MELLAKYKGFAVDRHEVTGKNGDPIQTVSNITVEFVKSKS